MQKNNILGGIATIAIIGGIIGYAAFNQNPRPSLSGTILPENGYTEHSQYYDIAANYATSTPLLQTLGPQKDATARALMNGFVRNTIDTFKSDGGFRDLSADEALRRGFDKDHKEKLTILYMVSSSPSTVSYIFTIYTDTLETHGIIDFKTFTFDTKTGNLITLNDLFLRNSEYLDALSRISRNKLPESIGNGADASFIQNGTMPEEKNFSRFFLDNGRIVFVFPPYQVAPYTKGPQTIHIPLTELGDILNPAYK